VPAVKELGLTELRRIARVLGEACADARVAKVVQPGAGEVALLMNGRERRWLLLSARPRAARIGALAEAPAAPPSPPAFAQYLRAHYEGARLAAVAVEGEDRQLRLRFRGAEGERSLLLSLLGPRSNLYALDAEDRVTAALRPLAETRRDLALGGPWRSPPGGPPSAGEDRFAEVPDAELLLEVERRFAAAAEQAEEADLGRRIASALRKQRASLEKKLALLEQDLAAQAEAEQLAKQGELLKAHLREVKAGQSAVTLADFATGEPVEVALDPKLSPSANLDAIFKRARKAEKRARKAAADEGAVRERIAALGALEAEARAAAGGTGEALAAFAARPELERLLARFAPAPAAAVAPEAPRKRVFRLGKAELPARLAPKVYETADGLEIWVGKNDDGNDVLTTRLARGNDLFFHLEGSPGSHVILRTEGRSDPPSESLLDAAELAVEFSKAKHATRASVHVAAVKDVSKPPGTKPGLVYVHRGRTLQLRRDPKRLERVLASRTEE
jgi:predicted ribosome quality control (RQC) complex YloA/Tae2 family protein